MNKKDSMPWNFELWGKKWTTKELKKGLKERNEKNKF